MKVKVSYFENVLDKTPKTIPLDFWLKATINPSKKLKSQINKYRNLKSKRLKENIPCITVSAKFKNKRKLNGAFVATNLICLDIDRFAKNKKNKCNLCVDFDKVKELLSQFKAVMYIGYSVSSDGINVKDGMYVIIKTHAKDNLKKCFNFYQKKLQRVGINIDESCKDYTRLRFFSYDANAYYNPKAEVFRIPKKRKLKGRENSNYVSKTDIEKVETIISIIENGSIDITGNYEDWYRIAGALYGSFGEKGRDYFHRISKHYRGYKEKETNRKYSNCANMNNVTLSTFFHIASNNGIRY